MALTGALLRQGTSTVPGGASGTKVFGWDDLAAGANAAMEEIGLTTRQACATFLASCALESDYWRTTTEYGSGQVYAPYVGRGFIQTTWEDGYRRAGRLAVQKGWIIDPEHFVKNPEALADKRYAWLGAIEYYTRQRTGSAWTVRGEPYRSLAALANSEHGTIERISRAINLGNPTTEKAAYHEEQRRDLADAFHALGDVIVPEKGHTGGYSPCLGDSTRYWIKESLVSNDETDLTADVDLKSLPIAEESSGPAVDEDGNEMEDGEDG